MGGKTQSPPATHRQQSTLDLALKRWTAGAKTVNRIYLETARLLTQLAPVVFQDGKFVPKGGTAINLFVRDMARANQ